MVFIRGVERRVGKLWSLVTFHVSLGASGDIFKIFLLDFIYFALLDPFLGLIGLSLGGLLFVFLIFYFFSRNTGQKKKKG